MTSPPPSIDADWIRRVAADVVARLRDSAADEATTPGGENSIVSLSDAVLVADSMASLHPGTTVLVLPRTVITPAAKDVARERQIEIKRSTQDAAAPVASPSSASATSPTGSCSLVDHSGRDWSGAIAHQLNLRGVAPAGATIVLSTQPAKETYEQIQSGRRAVSISRWVDAARFQAELSPDTWVVDVTDMNLIEAVNLITRIHSLGSPT